MTSKTAIDYLQTEKQHPSDEVDKPRWAEGPDGRYTDISNDIRFDQLFAEWQDDRCKHDRTGIVRWVNGGGQTCYNWFCAHCGCKLSSSIPHAAANDHGIVDAALDSLASRSNAYVAQRAQRLAELKAAAAERVQPGNREEYDDYLRSPRWRALRAKILLRARGVCEACLDSPAAEVHHLTYANLYNEPAWDLRAVCESCHDRFHLPRPAA